MSQPFGLDNGEVDPEENPEPEEDADWCQTEDVGNTGESYLPADQQGEEPEAISEIGAAEVRDENENGQCLHEYEEEPAISNSASLDVEPGDTPQEDERESVSNCLVEGDSFEQDEMMAAPESENGVIQQTCSESDQQLLGVQLSSSITASEENESADVSEASLILASNDGSNIAAFNTPSSNKSEDNLGEGADGNSLPHIFSGDVQVDASTGVDAPEDDYRLDHHSLLAEESAALPESGRVCLSGESPAIESQRINDILPEGDRDSQVPECDRDEEVNMSSQSCESSLQADQCVTESVSHDMHLESLNNCEANDTSQQNETGTDGGADIVNSVEASINFSLTAKSYCHSSEDQSDNTQKVSNVEPRADTSQKVDKSSSFSSPSHLQGQFQHSSESSPTHHSLSNTTDSVIHPTTSSPPLALGLHTTLPNDSSLGSVSSSPSNTLVSTPPTLNTSSTQDTSAAITPISHTGISSTSGSLNCANTPTDAAISPHSAVAAEVKIPVEDNHNGSQLNDSFHSRSHHNVTEHGEKSSFNQSKEGAKLLSPDDIQKQLSLALSNDEDDDLDDIMSELDAELLSRSFGRSPQRSLAGQHSTHHLNSLHANASVSDCEKSRLVNGMVDTDFKQLQDHNRQLLEQLKIRDSEITKLSQERDLYRTDLAKTQSELEEASAKASASSNHNADDLYLPQIKELENTIVQQQKETQASKDKLISHDTAAKRAVTTLQNELKNRVDQVTKLYEDAVKEKDSMVVMFAASESKVMESKRAADKFESRLKDAGKERESIISTLKAAKIDKQKAVNSYEQKCSEFGNLQREVEKLKEGLSSSDYRIKWFQNKLKEELEAHKETKSNLEKTTSKFKETKEETEIIRKECQAIVKTYQESEEIKSNSLDKELKMKESQFKLHMQEWSDTEEIHHRTKKELDSLKSEHKDAVAQVSALKEKVQSLETSVAEKDTVISQSNELLNKQKSDITDMSLKLKEKQNLGEDFTRAQEMIKTLDKDISELKISNRDLQKDMDSCRERESKMLALQSELSRTNACLRSENTTLRNKVTNQTADVERLKMEIQEMETTIKHLTDSIEDEKKNNTQTLTKLKGSLEEKTKESSDFKQKWEDEIDNNKTLKRRHANNIKDLTRQLHQTKRRLETLEGSRKDSGDSMGSRTNSNGSLNSMDNSHAGVAAGHHHSGLSSTHSAPPQDFPVITEQVEIDKQVLIERIVRLQKSHARKNEKLEFLGEHIQQLLEEIKKKTKIIQSYVMREEAGTLSSEDMDANKEHVNEAYKAKAQMEMQSLLSRKGGIMASVYTLHQQDGAMTLELSLQINKKLQAVLEDTLLKNITLKENLDTLGEEIARLSQVNRKLQLHLQDLENSKKN